MLRRSISGQVRMPAVAGLFYPDNAGELGDMVRGFLSEPAEVVKHPKALIAPHAGFIYSGPIAGVAFKQLAAARSNIRRVVMAGPSHRFPLRGVAVCSAKQFATPLGLVPVDEDGVAAVLDLPGVQVLDIAHAQEHSLETHLPFLQLALESFSIVPLVIGEAEPADVAVLFEKLWGGPETLIAVSSDLSHYRDYASAKKLDRVTAQAIEELEPEDIDFDQACGRIPVQALLLCARKHKLSVKTLDLRNSGDTAGPRTEVVGYGAWAFS